MSSPVDGDRQPTTVSDDDLVILPPWAKRSPRETPKTEPQPRRLSDRLRETAGTPPEIDLVELEKDLERLRER